MGLEVGSTHCMSRARAMLLAVCLIALVPGSSGLGSAGADSREGAAGQGRGKSKRLARDLGGSDGSGGSSGVEGTASSQSESLQPKQKKQLPSVPGHIMELSAPAHKQAVQLPKFINSASEHGEQPNMLDWIVLCVCLVAPVIVWGIAYISDALGARSEPVPDARLGRNPRIGSLSRLQEQTSGSMTPVSLLTQPLEPGSPEGTVLQNVLAGLASGLLMIPSAVSFSFITETSPVNTLWACAFMSISTSLVGGRPGMISGVSVASAAVLTNVSSPDSMGGMGPMALCVFIAGLMQVFLGLLRVSRLMTLIPHPVMLGFINGLALTTLRTQLRHFHEYGDGPLVSYGTRVGTMVIAGVAMFVAVAWRRAPSGKVMPAALASLIITSVFAFCVERMLPCRTLGDIAGPGVLEVGFGQIPKWDFPPEGMEWSNHLVVLKVLSTSMRLTLVGLLESLMTEALLDQITGTSGSLRRECFGQGFGNILAALFGTQGGCGLVGYSLLNVGSGGRGRLSGVSAGLTLIFCAMALAPALAAIPVGATMGIMILVALNTFAWGTFRIALRINLLDAVVVLIVMLLTMWYDIAVAGFVGVIVSGLGFAWRIATEARVESQPGGHDQRTFYLIGPLFFGSAMKYQKEMNPLMIAEGTVVLDFSKCRILDISGVDAVNKTRDFLVGHGKRVILKGLPRDMLQFLPVDAECEVPPPREDAP